MLKFKPNIIKSLSPNNISRKYKPSRILFILVIFSILVDFIYNKDNNLILKLSTKLNLKNYIDIFKKNLYIILNNSPKY